MANALEMKNICKYFSGVRANHNVNLTVRQGEVHALLGENGAGKSTLMNILYGLYSPTSGEVYINGEKANITSPQHAIDLGIGMVHQHFMLIPALTAIENVVLGMNETKNPVLDLKAAAKRLTDLAEKYNMSLDPFAMVSQMTVGQQQRLEILKALYRGAKLFIFDEPTAVLTPQEVEELFNMFRQLTSEGKTIIFISHKLHEVMTICDRCTILRLGEVAATVDIADTNRHDLAALMVGKEVDLTYDKAEMDPAAQKDILKVEGLCSSGENGTKALKNIDFTIKSGEIIGIAGVDGNGQSELVDCITGLLPVKSGKVSINGQDLTNAKPKQVLNAKVSHIPADRLARGVVPSMNLSENIALMNTGREDFTKGIFMRWSAIDEYTKEIDKKYNVKTPSHHELMQNLSGGNQQKVVLGREIERTPELLIAMHPARGLDIGATNFIQQSIVDERDRGAAVLLVSTELEEIYALSDRIAVMFEGEIMGIVPPTTPIDQLGMMMAGVRYEDIQKNEAAEA
ncbi:MAG: ABC transporter ATP-binding protein [Oscillospiraceae bacterium]|nr:ABC transporter ATP-binding protein [Oscillospiraceae bacterium]